MRFSTLFFTCGLAIICPVNSHAIAPRQALPSVLLPVLGTSDKVESDKVAFYYDSSPLLVGNDGSADIGGFHVFNIDSSGNNTALSEKWAQVTGRTKVVSTVYSVNDKDYIVTFSTPEHLLRFFDLDTEKEYEPATKFILAEFSALCPWKSPVTNAQYIFLFGKKEVRMYLLQEKENEFEAVEVVSFVLPIEAEACAAPDGASDIMFAGSDKKLYTFPASDVPSTPKVSVASETEEEITGATVYQLNKDDYIYLVAFEGSVSAYSKDFKTVGTLQIDAGEGLELSDIAIFQGETKTAKSGLIGYAFESDNAGKTFGVSSLQSMFGAFKLQSNTAWSPRDNSNSTQLPKCPAVKDCAQGGICESESTCKCYAGFAGADCSEVTCKNACSDKGNCVGPNTCECNPGFAGDDCSTVSVMALFETDANGADGDDPAIWIAPKATDSLIITTTKSEDDPGFSVFNLKGDKLQFISAGEPNNVDVIYGFPISRNQSIDLAYAGCRADNTLCLFQISATGTISAINGGSQTLPGDFEPYGSCVYRRSRDQKFFLFVNSKEARYLQFELTAQNGTLVTKLVRDVEMGSGTQPEGCVVDEENEVIFVGEEQIGLWKYGANPEDPGKGSGVLIDSVDKEAGGKMNADVEGMALVYGKTKGEGYVMVSMQGVSAYNVYERAAPHKYVMTFNIGNNEEAGIDKVTNTDGIAAVGTNLGGDFEQGLIVTHDDANEKPDGTTDVAASFKLMSLGDVLTGELAKHVDGSYDPRK